VIYEIETKEKKNVYTTSYYTMPNEGIAANKQFRIEEMFRWGKATIEADEPITESEDPYKIPFNLTCYDIQDQEFDDGCSLYIYFDETWTEEEKQYVQDLWDQECYSGLEENGIELEEVDTEFYGPLEITLIDESQTVPSKGSWPN